MMDTEDIIRQYNTHDWAPEEGRTAVLLIDLQEYFRGIIRPILDNVVFENYKSAIELVKKYGTY